MPPQRLSHRSPPSAMPTDDDVRRIRRVARSAAVLLIAAGCRSARPPSPTAWEYHEGIRLPACGAPARLEVRNGSVGRAGLPHLVVRVLEADSGRAVQAARVRLRATADGAQDETPATGEVRLAFGRGDYQLEVTRIGYYPFTGQVALHANRIDTVIVYLKAGCDPGAG